MLQICGPEPGDSYSIAQADAAIAAALVPHETAAQRDAAIAAALTAYSTTTNKRSNRRGLVAVLHCHAGGYSDCLRHSRHRPDALLHVDADRRGHHGGASDLV